MCRPGRSSVPQHLLRTTPAGDACSGSSIRELLRKFAGSRRGTHLDHVPCGSRRITGVRNFQAGAGIAAPRPLAHFTIRRDLTSPLFASGGDLHGNGRHVVVLRSRAAKVGDRLEDRVDDRARRSVALRADDVRQPAAPNSTPSSFIASKMPSVQNTNTSPLLQRELDLVVGHAGKRPERHAGQLDLPARLSPSSGSDTAGRNWTASRAARRKSKNA